MDFSITLTGGEELERKLKALEPKIAKKLVGKILRDAAGCIASQAKTNASVNVGGGMGALISENIIVKPARRQKKFSYKVMAMIRAGVNAFVHITKDGMQYYIPSAIEYGHALPYQVTAGEAATGSEIAKLDRLVKKNLAGKAVPAIPFMRPAFDARKGLALKIIESELERELKNK